MASLLYYEEERKRWPQLNVALCSFAEAQEAIRRWAKHYDLPSPQIAQTTGRRRSYANAVWIVLNTNYWGTHVPQGKDWRTLCWRTVAHEFAHFWMFRQWPDNRPVCRSCDGTGTWRPEGASVSYPCAKCKGQKRLGKKRNRHHHGQEHVERVDILCKWILREAWERGTIAHELALKDQARTTKRRERAAAMPNPIEVRIARREEQVKRLTRKVKNLTTRLNSARRSLAALRRRHPDVP